LKYENNLKIIIIFKKKIINMGEFEGLSNVELSKLAELLQIPIRGVFADDQLPDKIKVNEGGIVNLQHQDQPGTHWVAYFNSNNDYKKVYAYDSLGFPPDERLEPYLKTAQNRGKKKQLEYFEYPTQPDESTLCGYYALYFLDMMFKGNSFNDTICSLKTNPADIHLNDKIVITYLIQQLYENPLIGTSGIENFIVSVESYLPGVKKKDIRDHLSQNTYLQKHRVQKNPIMFRHFYSPGPNIYHQADVLHLYTTQSGYKYILFVIDIYSRYLQVEPLKVETSATVIDAFNDIYKRDKFFTFPKHLEIDNGPSVSSKEFTSFMYNKGTGLIYQTPGEKKFLSIVNAAHKTISKRLYQWMEIKDSHNWDEILDAAVKKYNMEAHNFTTAKIKPLLVQSGQTKPEYKDFSTLKIPMEPKYRLGDKVRLFSRKEGTPKEGTKRRATDETFSNEIHTIVGVREGRPGDIGRSPEPVVYSIQDDVAGTIINNVYEPELTRIKV
jgi:hypothetical protein